MTKDLSERHFEIKCDGNTVIVTVLTDLGEFEHEELLQEVQEAFELLETDATKCHVVVDFRRSDYFGSTALGLLVRLSKRVRQRGGQMVICGLSPHEREILKVTHLDTLWPICATTDEALQVVTETQAPHGSSKGASERT